MLLSVDGGATKTVAIIFDEDSFKIRGVGVSGPSNLTSAGPVQARKNIESAIQMAIAKLSMSVKDMRAGIFGIAGIGDSREMTELGIRIIDEVSGRRDFVKVNDGVPAYFLGNIEKDGIVFAGGTGSVAFFGKDKKIERRGGWNWFVGDDGSASWMAKRALNLATQEEDGLFEEKRLVSEVEDYFGNEFREAIAYVDRNQDKAFIAGFAPRISKLAYEGYGRAKQVLEESSQYVSSMINSLKKQFSSTPLISLIGGTMQAGNQYIDMIKSRVGNSVQVFPGYQVAIGGILILLKDLSYSVDFNARNEIVKQMDTYLKSIDKTALEMYLHIEN